MVWQIPPNLSLQEFEALCPSSYSSLAIQSALPTVVSPADPVPLTLQLMTALTAAETSAVSASNAAAASAAATLATAAVVIAMAPPALGQTMVDWFASLPTIEPSTPGILWNNGNTLARS